MKGPKGWKTISTSGTSIHVCDGNQHYLIVFTEEYVRKTEKCPYFDGIHRKITKKRMAQMQDADSSDVSSFAGPYGQQIGDTSFAKRGSDA